MATKQEIAELLKLINLKYPSSQIQFTEMILSHWHHVLIDLDSKILLAAVEHHAKDNPAKVPNALDIAKVADHLKYIRDGKDPLSEIQKCLRKYGLDEKKWPTDDAEVQLLLKVAKRVSGLEAINNYDHKTAEFKRDGIAEIYKVMVTLKENNLFDNKKLLSSEKDEKRTEYFMSNAEAEKFALSRAPGSGLSAQDWFQMGQLGIKDPKLWKEKGYQASPLYAKGQAGLTPEEKKNWDQAKIKVDEEIKNEYAKPIINYTKLYGANPLQALKGEELQKFKDQRRKDSLAKIERDKKLYGKKEN